MQPTRPASLQSAVRRALELAAGEREQEFWSANGFENTEPRREPQRAASDGAGDAARPPARRACSYAGSSLPRPLDPAARRAKRSAVSSEGRAGASPGVQPPP